MESRRISSVRDLFVYQRSFKVAVRIFQLVKVFPKEERYALSDQILRSSRSVCANLSEAWRKRKYKAAFVRNAPKRQLKHKRGWSLR